MRKIPISGGPHAGKTTIFEALKAEFPEAHFVPEPAEIVISRELAKQAEKPLYEPIVPWLNYDKFLPVVLEESLRLESEIPHSAKLVFQDRSLVDNIGYARVYGLDEAVPNMQRHVVAANYAFALFCEPVGTYTPTQVRRENDELAQNIHQKLAEAYEDVGIKVVHLPAVSVEDRMSLIRATIDAL